MATRTITSQATATASKPSPAKAQQLSAHPFIGILGVFVGAGTATLHSRLIGIGLPDLRGALGLDFDEAAWIPTALNMALMFSGVFCVFLNALWGPRRILFPCAAVFMFASLALPFSPTPAFLFPLVVIAGLASGTFYSLTLTLRFGGAPQAAGYLGHCRLCCRHRFFDQHRGCPRGLVPGARLMALDFLELSHLDAADDALHLFRRPRA